MLNLTRYIGESFMIGDDIKITILDSRKNKVRIGIDAPKHIPVHRQEIYLQIKKEKRNCLNGQPSTIVPQENCSTPAERSS